jgi:hypothetical protein
MFKNVGLLAGDLGMRAHLGAFCTSSLYIGCRHCQLESLSESAKSNICVTQISLAEPYGSTL